MEEWHIKEHPLKNEGAGGADMRSTFLANDAGRQNSQRNRKRCCRFPVSAAALSMKKTMITKTHHDAADPGCAVTEQS